MWFDEKKNVWQINIWLKDVKGRQSNPKNTADWLMEGCMQWPTRTPGSPLWTSSALPSYLVNLFQLKEDEEAADCQQFFFSSLPILFPKRMQPIQPFQWYWPSCQPFSELTRQPATSNMSHFIGQSLNLIIRIQVHENCERLVLKCLLKAMFIPWHRNIHHAE